MAYAKITLPFKDPNEVLDYSLDWSERLGLDTIVTSTWEMAEANPVTETNPDTALVIDSDTKTDTSTTVWLSGGSGGAAYIVTNRVVTAGGRTMDQSVKLKIKDK